jgi:hypothetical protein
VQRALECGGSTPLFVFQSFNVAKAFRDFREFRGLKKAAQQRRTPKYPFNPRNHGLKEFLEKFLQKSIDILLRVRLKGAPSLALACSAAGELTTGKNKKSGKNRKKY